jgi:hypothetical protein
VQEACGLDTAFSVNLRSPNKKPGPLSERTERLEKPRDGLFDYAPNSPRVSEAVLERSNIPANPLDFSTSQSRRRVRVMMIGFVLPWPAMLDLEMQEDAEESADDDDQAKNLNVVQGGIYNNSVNDVASYKELEPEQNRSSHILATKAVCVNRVAFSPKEKSNRGNGRSNDHDGDASGLYHSANNFNDLLEVYHKTQI